MAAPSVHIVVAPDKFKGSASAVEVAGAIAAGLRRTAPAWAIVEAPIADGGDGTLATVLAAGYLPVAVHAQGPTGQVIETRYARSGSTAVVELASVCGSSRLVDGRPQPLASGTYGFGEVIAAAMEAGCRRLILGLGGSASTDGGLGMLSALGARITDANGHVVEPNGTGLRDVDDVDLSNMHPLLADCEILVACDVGSPLLGPRGASRLYARQKGATAAEVDALERSMSRWAAVLTRATDTNSATEPGAGAAGGVGFAACAALGAQLCRGIDLILDLINFAALLDGCALVVTGEGALDTQTAEGKAVAGVAAAAHAAGVPTIAVVGRNDLRTEDITALGIARVYSIAGIEPVKGRQVTHALSLIARLAEHLGQSLGHDQPST